MNERHFPAFAHCPNGPLLLKAVGQDPALGAGVIVTAFTDAFGFFTFLGIATLLLDRLL